MADFLLSSRWVVLGGLVVLPFAIDLIVIPIEMIAGEFVEWPVWLPLFVTLGILGAAVAGSIWMRRGGRVSRKHA